jgi:hypothetical protein
LIDMLRYSNLAQDWWCVPGILNTLRGSAIAVVRPMARGTNAAHTLGRLITAQPFIRELVRCVKQKMRLSPSLETMDIYVQIGGVPWYKVKTPSKSMR